MLQAAFPSIGSQTGKQWPVISALPEWLRLCIALAVLLLAVVPHATIAVSAGHAVPSFPGPALHGGAPATSPCHEANAPTEAAGTLSCCTLGCGLIAFTDVAAPHLARTSWRALSPWQAHWRRDCSPEPAERPPRGPATA